MKTIGGTVNGLTGTGLVLNDNTADDLTVNASGPFTFAISVFSTYAVTVKTPPTNPSQSCTVSGGVPGSTDLARACRPALVALGPSR